MGERFLKHYLKCSNIECLHFYCEYLVSHIYEPYNCNKRTSIVFLSWFIHGFLGNLYSPWEVCIWDTLTVNNLLIFLHWLIKNPSLDRHAVMFLWPYVYHVLIWRVAYVFGSCVISVYLEKTGSIPHDNRCIAYIVIFQFFHVRLQFVQGVSGKKKKKKRFNHLVLCSRVTWSHR